MQRSNWSSWKNFLEKSGLLSPVCSLLTLDHSLVPIAAQVLYLGMPLFKIGAEGNSFSELLDLLVDEDALRQFSDYLLLSQSGQEVEA
jgi:hypothetical protein